MATIPPDRMPSRQNGANKAYFWHRRIALGGGVWSLLIALLAAWLFTIINIFALPCAIVSRIIGVRNSGKISGLLGIALSGMLIGGSVILVTSWIVQSGILLRL